MKSHSQRLSKLLLDVLPQTAVPNEVPARDAPRPIGPDRPYRNNALWLGSMKRTNAIAGNAQVELFEVFSMQ